MNQLKNIEKIKVAGKEYFVTFLALGRDHPISLGGEYYCAYVYLDNPNLDGTLQLDCCTFHEGNVYGIDTAHHYNMEQNLEEKMEDARRQIIELIKSYCALNKSNTHHGGKA